MAAGVGVAGAAFSVDEAITGSVTFFVTSGDSAIGTVDVFAIWGTMVVETGATVTAATVGVSVAAAGFASGAVGKDVGGITAASNAPPLAGLLSAVCPRMGVVSCAMDASGFTAHVQLLPMAAVRAVPVPGVFVGSANAVMSPCCET
jgi:hypothetical protein